MLGPSSSSAVSNTLRLVVMGCRCGKSGCFRLRFQLPLWLLPERDECVPSDEFCVRRLPVRGPKELLLPSLTTRLPSDLARFKLDAPMA